jgi:hypothetical protein
MESDMAEPWRECFREGLAPLLSTAALQALRDALQRDDPALCQRATTIPPPMPFATEWPCEGCCLLGYAGWRGEGLTTVGEVEEFFVRMCWEIDQRLGEPAACQYLLNAFDAWDRPEMIAHLFPEVELALAARTDAAA